MPRSASVLIRHARWLLEQAEPQIIDTPQCHRALEATREFLATRAILGQLAGDYRPGEVEAFAALEPVSKESVHEGSADITGRPRARRR